MASLAATVNAANVNISYAVTDTGGSHLKDIEVWRAPDNSGSPGTYVEVSALRQTIASQNLDGYSNSALVDTPGNGTWWYGIHVVDQAGNIGTETTAQRQKVTVAVCSNHTLSFTANKDDTIVKQGPTTNSGNSGILVTQAYTTGNDIQRVLISFDASSIVGASAITSATLTLQYYGPFMGSVTTDPKGRTIQVYELKTPTVYRNFVEGNATAGSGATWNTYDGSTNWTTAGGGGDYVTSSPSGATALIPSTYPTPMTWTITGIVQDAVTNAVSSGGKVNIIMKDSIETVASGNYVPYWNSKDSGVNMPTLTINYQTCP